MLQKYLLSLIKSILEEPTTLEEELNELLEKVLLEEELEVDWIGGGTIVSHKIPAVKFNGPSTVRLYPGALNNTFKPRISPPIVFEKSNVILGYRV